MFEAHEFIGAARAQAGLDDFGDDYFREGLDKLLHAAETEIRLNPRGRAALRARTIGYLVNRLEVEHWYKLHPEIEDEEIVAPLFGLGLPRTGSTVLQCLLAEDVSARSLRTWESEKPCPPPVAETQDTDPRIAMVEASQAGFNELARLAPEILTMLPLEGPRDPTECQDLLGLSVRNQAFVATALFGYIDWLAGSDTEPAYRYHKRALKLLQWRCPPKKWRLKSPVHMLNLNALDKVYPDARFVVTHRDVVDSIPSMAALVAAIGGLFVDGLDVRAVGTGTARIWRIALDRMIDFRDRHPTERFRDIAFRAMQVDPIRGVRGLYDWLGESCTPEFEGRMQAWREAHPKGKHGEHDVDPAAFGMSADGLRDQYARYLDRYSAFIA